jgi:L-lactate dehydrogenase (cytochrome)
MENRWRPARGRTARHKPLAGFTLRWSADATPISIEDYRRHARRVLPDVVWAFIESAAEDRVTVDANREAFRRWALRTAVLTGCSAPRLHVTVAGVPLELPVVLAPTGSTALVHWTGELGASRAAERAGTRATLSTFATYSIEQVAAGTRDSHFFQVVPWANTAPDARELVLGLVRRAARSGYAALVVTVDVPVLGNREWEQRRGIAVPPVLTPRRIADVLLHPRWLYGCLEHRHVALRTVAERGRPAGTTAQQGSANLLRAGASWDSIARLREEWKGPLLVKGVLSADDAERAVALGADGIVVSNHGGRQLDGAVASLDALRAVADRVRGRADVLLDGGVRRGSDIVKALCLGATAVCIGRPFLYGLAVDGVDGARDVLEILRAELSRTLTLMGAADVRGLDDSWLVPAA